MIEIAALPPLPKPTTRARMALYDETAIQAYTAACLEAERAAGARALGQLREAAEQAMEALLYATNTFGDDDAERRSAIAALRDALALLPPKDREQPFIAGKHDKV